MERTRKAFLFFSEINNLLQCRTQKFWFELQIKGGKLVFLDCFWKTRRSYRSQNKNRLNWKKGKSRSIPCINQINQKWWLNDQQTQKKKTKVKHKIRKIRKLRRARLEQAAESFTTKRTQTINNLQTQRNILVCRHFCVKTTATKPTLLFTENKQEVGEH